MRPQIAAILGLLVSESLCGYLKQRQLGSNNYTAIWNVSSTVTSSSSFVTPSLSESDASSNRLTASASTSSLPVIVLIRESSNGAPTSSLVSTSDTISTSSILASSPINGPAVTDSTTRPSAGPGYVASNSYRSITSGSPPTTTGDLNTSSSSSSLSSSTLPAVVVLATSGSTSVSPFPTVSNETSSSSLSLASYLTQVSNPIGSGMFTTLSSYTSTSVPLSSSSFWQGLLANDSTTVTSTTSSPYVQAISGLPSQNSANATGDTTIVPSVVFTASSVAQYISSDASSSSISSLTSSSNSSNNSASPTNSSSDVTLSTSSPSLVGTAISVGISVSPNTTSPTSPTLPIQTVPTVSAYATGYVASSNSKPAATSGGYLFTESVAPTGGIPQGTYPSGTAPYSVPAPFPLPYNVSLNATSCGGATINIPDATLNWWYSTDIDYAAATFSALYNYNDTYTGWTLIDASTTFDVATALAAPTYSSYTTYNTYINESYVYYYEYTTPTPEYASTEVVTQTATVPLNVSTGTGNIPSTVMTTPDPASTVLPGPSSAALTALTNTPFVYFTEFAVDIEKPTRVKNGLTACVTSREIYTLKSPFALYYPDDDPEGQSVVTGDLPDEFLDEVQALHIPLRQLKLGTYAAEPTLLVVVEEVYAAAAVLAAHTESSESALAIPTVAASAASAVSAYVTLTPHVESSQSSLMVASPSKGNYISGVLFFAHTEVAETTLLVPSPTSTTPATQLRIPQVTGTVKSPTLVPFTAVIGNTVTTLLLPSDSAGVITTTLPGSIVVTASVATATALQNQNGNSGGVAVIVSAIQAGSGSQSGNSGGSNSGSGSESLDTTGETSGAGSSETGSGGGTGSGSGSGSNNAGSAQASQPLANLISAIQQAGQSNGAGAQATAVAGSGSSGNGNSGAEGSQSGGSASGGSSSGGSSSGGSSSGGGSSPGAESGQSGSGSSSDDGSSSSGNVLVPVPVVIGGVTTSIGPSSNLVIDSHTISPGGPAITVSGTPISLGSNGVVIGTSTHEFATSLLDVPSPVSANGGSGGIGSGAGSSPVITVGSSTITQAPVPIFVVGGHTLVPGSTITADGKAIEYGAGGALVIDGSSISMAVPNSPVTFTAGGETIAIRPTPAFVIGGSKTLFAGGPAITVDGTQLSLAPSASALIFDGSVTSNLATSTANIPLALTIGSDVLTANAATQFLLGSRTILSPGGQATIDGTTVSLNSKGSVAVINGVSQTLTPPTITPGPLLTFGGTVYEANSGSTFDVANRELTPGGVITVDGTTISLANDASLAVINGVTQTLRTVASPVTTPEPTAVEVLSFGGQKFTAKSGSTFVIDGSTLSLGGVITLGEGSSATTISLDGSGTGSVVVNGVTSTISLEQETVSPVSGQPDLTIGGQTITADTFGDYVLSGQTLIPGGSAITFTTQGTVETVSLDSGGGILVVNGVTSTLSAEGSLVTPGPLTIDGQVYYATIGSGGPSYVISGQTLTEGGVITFTDGSGVETVSLTPQGTAVVINGVTSTVKSASTITAAPDLTVDGQIITPAAGSGTTYLVSGKVLTPGGSVVFNGPNGVETVSLSPDGSTLIEAVSGASTTSALPTAFGIAQTAAPIITIGDETFTALPGPGPSYLLPDGQTLYPGGPSLTETIDGSVYIVSLSPQATVLVVEDVGPGGVVTRTEIDTLFPATITRSRGTATVTSDINDDSGAGTTTRGHGAASTPTSDSDASLQGSAVSDKQIGGILMTGGVGIALLAVLL